MTPELSTKICDAFFLFSKSHFYRKWLSGSWCQTLWQQKWSTIENVSCRFKLFAKWRTIDVLRSLSVPENSIKMPCKRVISPFCIVLSYVCGVFFGTISCKIRPLHPEETSKNSDISDFLKVSDIENKWWSMGNKLFKVFLLIQERFVGNIYI